MNLDGDPAPVDTTQGRRTYGGNHGTLPESDNPRRRACPETATAAEPTTTGEAYAGGATARWPQHTERPGRSVGHTAPMGFDPTRTHKRTRFDYFYVAASVIVCVALVTWALFS